MTEAVYGVFDNLENAERAISALKDHGVGGNEISVVRRSDGAGLPRVESEASEGITVTGPADVTAGALKGGAAGLAVGVLASAVALTIPGIGPILAAGPLAAAIGATLGSTAAGAIGGGVVGYLVDQGVPDEHAAHIHESIVRGDILVTVRSSHVSSVDALALLEKYGATSLSRHDVRDPLSGPEEPPVVDRAAAVDSAPATTPATTTPSTASTTTP